MIIQNIGYVKLHSSFLHYFFINYLKTKQSGPVQVFL